VNMKHRIPAIQISRTMIAPLTVLSQYTAGYCLYSVKSHFTGSEKLDDLLYQIILHRQMQNNSDAAHDTS